MAEKYVNKRNLKYSACVYMYARWF